MVLIDVDQLGISIDRSRFKIRVIHPIAHLRARGWRSRNPIGMRKRSHTAQVGLSPLRRELARSTAAVSREARYVAANDIRVPPYAAVLDVPPR
jgi:hypothetical protein